MPTSAGGSRWAKTKVAAETMGINTAYQRPTAVEGETNLFSVDMSGLLDDDEVFTGTPTVSELTTSDLSITNVSVSTETLTILGKSVSLGEAIQFKVSGQLAASGPYRLKITASTDSTPAQTKVRIIEFPVLSAS